MSRRSHLSVAVAAVLISVVSPNSVTGGHAAPVVIIVSTTVDATPCTQVSMSLRCAVVAANASSAGASVQFDIPSSAPGCAGPPGVCVLSLTSPLPALVGNSIVVDGYSQPGAMAGSAATTRHVAVHIEGSAIAPVVDGLVLQGANITIRGLWISGFKGSAIRIAGGGSDLLTGNALGAGPADSGSSIQNGGDGVSIITSGNNVVGGTQSADGNVISGNAGAGINLSQTSGNFINGNLIGTDQSGSKAIPNAGGGLLLDSAGKNTIGGSVPGAGNLVSGNGKSGITIRSASGNVIEENYIGADAAGTSAIPNAGSGILLDNVSGNSVGGPTPGSGNVISGNRLHGVEIQNASGNLVRGNDIGTDAKGASPLGNGRDGIEMVSVNHNTIGGPSQGNVISGNKGHGVELVLSGANMIRGNEIGVGLNGHGTLGNDGNGVYLHASSDADIVTRNIIAGNRKAGVLVGSSASDGSHEFISRNSTYGNRDLGIDLFPLGVVNCSPSSPGPNDYTPCPRIRLATPLRVSGTACASCVVEVYLATNRSYDLHHGAGKTFLGAARASGSNQQWTLRVRSGKMAAGSWVTATSIARAKGGPGETSEFSKNVRVTAR